MSQSDEAYLWRVCNKWGLPRLVFMQRSHTKPVGIGNLHFCQIVSPISKTNGKMVLKLKLVQKLGLFKERVGEGLK